MILLKKLILKKKQSLPVTTFKTMHHQGLLLLNKPKTKTSFYLVTLLRKLTKIRCIGHAGTLDPFATGVMVMLIGKPYTKKANEFLTAEKEYIARVSLGVATDTFDSDGIVTATSDLVPSEEQIKLACSKFQGETLQIPPMFSAKKVNGKKLYELARQGKVIERAPKKVNINLDILYYEYPILDLHVQCSSGTYIRTLADDIGSELQCGAHLSELTRTAVGPFKIDQCQNCEDLTEENLNIRKSW
jgi:tRNA pseudouridine55 synthase